MHHEQILHLGYYAEEEEAARVYDAAARRLRGASARQNFPVSPLAPDADAASPGCMPKQGESTGKLMRSADLVASLLHACINLKQGTFQHHAHWETRDYPLPCQNHAR